MSKYTRKELYRFFLSGCVCFLIDYSLLFILTEWIGFYYLFSAGISFSISLIVNHLFCTHYIFKEAGHQTKSQIFLFFITGVIGLGLNQLCIWIFSSVFGIYYMLSKLAATSIVMIWNYLTKRWAIIGKSSQKKKADLQAFTS